MLGAGFLWYFKYRSRGIPRIARGADLRAYPDLWIATVQGALPSRFYGSSDTADQVAHKSTQIGRTPVPQQAVPSRKLAYPTLGGLPSCPQSADDEPVEAGLMLREMSTSGTLPLYGPGGVRHNEAVPPQAGQYIRKPGI